MHCDSPTCADVCPADAIKRSGDGRVMTARKPRCIACSNCVLACPFGVPKMMTEFDLMMKCDMCYDRTSTGRKPMCATVCPSGALFFGTREEVERLRKRSRPINQFQFGQQTITHEGEHDGARASSPVEHLDVTAAMHEPPAGGLIALNVLTAEATGGAVMSQSTASEDRDYPDGRPLSEQPRWRQDFPTDVPEDDARRPGGSSQVPGPDQRGVRRRAVLDRADEPAAGRQAAPRASGSPPWRTLAARRVVEFRYPTEDDPCLLIRLARRPAGRLRPEVQPPVLRRDPASRSEGELHCPCHNGYFEISEGRPIAGPPRRPLPRITLEVRDGVIYATGVELRTV